MRAAWTSVGLAVLLLLGSIPAAAQTPPAVPDRPVAGPEDETALRTLVGRLCDTPIVMLGEAYHGNSHTDAFKVELVRRLISRCGFDALSFESSYYEFAEIKRMRRRGVAVGADRIGTAVGGLWKFDAAFQPLLPFLAERVAAGQLILSGLDYQLGGFEQPYANDALPIALAAYLPAGRRAACSDALHTRIYGSYDRAARPDWFGVLRR